MGHETLIATGAEVLADHPLALPRSHPARQHFGSREPELATTAAESRMWNELLGAEPLEPAEAEALARLARHRVVVAGGSVFNHQERARCLVLVRDGEVALGYCTPDGAFHIERPVRGPGWLDCSSAWLGEPHAFDARASRLSAVIELPAEALSNELERHPGLTRRLLDTLAREVNTLARATHGLMHQDAPARFAAWLLQRCQVDARDANRGVVQLAERKRDIASQLAITPETLSRLMKSFSARSILDVAGYTLQVLDLRALQRLASGG